MYIAKAHLNLSFDEFWLMPIGLILDLWECHRQYHGISKPKIKKYIDEVKEDVKEVREHVQNHD